MRPRAMSIAVLVLATACAGSQGPTGPTASPPPGATSPPLDGASCNPRTGGDEDAAMLLTGVRVAPQAGFDRVVFEFEPREGEPAGIPFHEVGVATPPLIEDPSGEELNVEGESFLSAVIFASGVDLSGDEPREVYTGPDRIQPSGAGVVAEVREGGDFENTMNWYVGLTAPACFVVSTLTDPVRIVVDIEA